jgi:hypothetical protein
LLAAGAELRTEFTGGCRRRPLEVGNHDHTVSDGYTRRSISDTKIDFGGMTDDD